jgi:hypothetical protein
MLYRVRTNEGTVVQYLDKAGRWTPNVTRARTYTGLGPLKNSIGHWSDAKLIEVVELELRETGQILPLESLLAPLKAKRQAKLDQRTSTERLAERNRDLAELERLKVKYGR